MLTPTQRRAADASSDEPIPVRVRVGHDDFLPTAWRLAVLGAAELLCVRYTARVAPTGTRPDRRVGDRGRTSTRSLADRRYPRRPPWLGTGLTPTAQTARAVDSYVVGHLRHLAFSEASVQAHENAQSVGIEIPFGFTWVKPHARGLPPDGALEFRWHPVEVQQVDASRWDLGGP